ncbi:MAG: hypothetical protein IM638_06030 [Bacteroidetes bacterium]|nr:hypothetical protein [Bacteroidota bacterium]
MKTTLFYLLTSAAILAAVLQPSCSEEHTATNVSSPAPLVPSLTWTVPVDLPDSPATQVQFTLFGWQSFVALNWPARLDQRGLPDTNKKFGQSGPVVWETFKGKEQTFLPSAADPGPWATAGEDLTKKNLSLFSKTNNDTINLDTLGTGGNVDEFDQADGGYPLIDQNGNYVTYEILINESEYEYIRENQYYNGINQKNDVHNSAFVIPPKGPNSDADTTLMNTLPPDARYGATEIKAAWRIIPADMPASQKARYYCRQAVRTLPGGATENVEIGLVGLHILRLTRSTHNTWIWATFEHVDNDTIMASYGGNSSMKPTFNPGPGGTPAPPYPLGYCFNTNDCSSSGLPAIITPSMNGLPVQPPVNVSRVNPIDPLVDSLNGVYQKLFSGTVWQYFRMIGVLNQVPTGNSNTAVPNAPGVYVNAFPLPNITMETYAQTANANFGATNCVSCHAFGFPQAFPGDKKLAQNYQIFTFLLSDAVTDTSTARKPRSVKMQEAEKPKN